MISTPRERTNSSLILTALAISALFFPQAQLHAQEIPAGTEHGSEAPEPEEQPRADLSEANALVRDNRYAEAVDLLAGLRQTYPDDPGLLLMLGELLLATNRPDEAVAPLEQAAGIAPGRERINFQLGSALAKTGKLEGALEAFDRELKITADPEIIVLSRFNRSFLLERKKEFAPAAEELEMVLMFQPDRKEVYGDLASLYLRAGNPQRGLDALERGESFGFVSADHYYSLGAKFYLDRQYEHAITTFERTLEIDPTKAEAERSMAACLEKLGRDGEAADHLRRFLELRPDSPHREQIEKQIKAASADGS